MNLGLFDPWVLNIRVCRTKYSGYRFWFEYYSVFDTCVFEPTERRKCFI